MKKSHIFDPSFSIPFVMNGKIYFDNRGSFRQLCVMKDMKQINVSVSSKGVIRGMHWQIRNPQDKVLSCLFGEIYDVCVDLRPRSPNFGVVYEFMLDGGDNNQLFIPKGFAHGFQANADHNVVTYLIRDAYDPKDEYGCRFDSIDADWKTENTDEWRNQNLSSKDLKWPRLEDIKPEMLPQI